MNRYESEALDRHITGNYGKDFLQEFGKTGIIIKSNIIFEDEPQATGFEIGSLPISEGLWTRGELEELVYMGKFHVFAGTVTSIYNGSTRDVIGLLVPEDQIGEEEE